MYEHQSSAEKLLFNHYEQFSEGKNPPKNEDVIGRNESTLVLCDGATDKSGKRFEGPDGREQTGGELAARLAVETCMHSDKFGQELVDEISSNILKLYESINPDALEDSSSRFGATLVVAKAVSNEIIITQIGDTSFRINAEQVFMNDKLIDQITANARKEYIEATGDTAGSRDFIMPLLKQQHKFQNNPDHPLGYGVLDGTQVPVKFVKTFCFQRGEVHTLEIVSDGYFGAFPEEATTNSYEEIHRQIERVDPDKYKKYISTKSSDDRAVLIAKKDT